MTISELNKALAKASMVFVWCPLTADDGAYVEVSKAAFKRALAAQQTYFTDDYSATLRDVDTDTQDLYIG